MQYKCTTRQAVRPVGYGPSLREAQLLPPGPRGTRPWHPARPLPCHPVALRSVPAAALTCSRPAPASAPRARPHEPRPCTPVGGYTPRIPQPRGWSSPVRSLPEHYSVLIAEPVR